MLKTLNILAVSLILFGRSAIQAHIKIASQVISTVQLKPSTDMYPKFRYRWSGSAWRRKSSRKYSSEFWSLHSQDRPFTQSAQLSSVTVN